MKDADTVESRRSRHPIRRPAALQTQHIPRLAGQQPDYLRTRLLGFKAGTRFDMDGNMTAAAQALTPADIETLANYLSTLR